MKYIVVDTYIVSSRRGDVFFAMSFIIAKAMSGKKKKKWKKSFVKMWYRRPSRYRRRMMDVVTKSMSPREIDARGRKQASWEKNGNVGNRKKKKKGQEKADTVVKITNTEKRKRKECREPKMPVVQIPSRKEQTPKQKRKECREPKQNVVQESVAFEKIMYFYVVDKGTSTWSRKKAIVGNENKSLRKQQHGRDIKASSRKQ